jgi:hypothetical protein
VYELLNHHRSGKSALADIGEKTVSPWHRNQRRSLGAIELAMQLDGGSNSPGN